MMRVYEFTAKGLALGAVIVVIANTSRWAKKMAEAWATQNGIDTATIQQSKVTRYGGGSQVVYGWNGDY